MPKWLCKLYLTITRFCMSFRQRNRIHIGSEIYHIPTGNVMFVNDCNMFKDGVQYFSAVAPSKRLYLNKISRMDIEKMPGWKNWWYNSTAWWRWYKHNWLEMDMNAMSKRQPLRSIFVLGKERATARR